MTTAPFIKLTALQRLLSCAFERLDTGQLRLEVVKLNLYVGKINNYTALSKRFWINSKLFCIDLRRLVSLKNSTKFFVVFFQPFQTPFNVVPVVNRHSITSEVSYVY